MRHRLLSVSPFVFLILIAAQAQSQHPSVRVEAQQAPTFSVSVNLIKVPISIFDERGAMVQNLRREDFRIYEDGVQQDIRSFGRDSNPVSVVLLLDTSATVEKELKKIKEAAENFAAALSNGDRVSIITFADNADLALDWTANRKLVHKALRKVESGLRTALYDAMLIAAGDQLGGVEGRKAIVLLTDGLNNQSSVSFRDAALSTVQSQASLYVVSKTIMVREAARTQRRVMMLSNIYKRMFGDDNYIEEFFRRREAEFADLSEKTGGRCFFPTDYDQVKDVYSQVAQELRSQYFLTYISNQRRMRNSFHEISVEYLPPASKINYRKGYYFEPNPVRKRRY